MAEQLDEMYRDIIMEHYRFPRGHEKIIDPDIKNEGHNPACGDEIEIQVKMDENKIKTADINYKSLKDFSKIAVMNALTDFHIIENAIIS